MNAPSDNPHDSAALAAELAEVRARFDAIVSNTPGLVYQFVLHADGAVSFPYPVSYTHLTLPTIYSV